MGNPDYNVLNECCRALNSDHGGSINPPGTGFTELAQETINYMVSQGAGRDAFVRFWKLMAEAVASHPSAIAAELINEPMCIKRNDMFETWRACQRAINQVIPDMSVSIMDVGEGSVIPSVAVDILNSEIVAWIRNSTNLMYTWHYGNVPEDIHAMELLSLDWNVPTVGTELGCKHFAAAKSAGISHFYWHYSSYCDHHGWGKCILGYGNGGSSMCEPGRDVMVV